MFDFTHINFSLEHNPHKVYYVTVEAWADGQDTVDVAGKVYHLYDSPEELQEMVDKDEVWYIFIHPYTAVGSTSFCAPTFERLMQKVKEWNEA